LPPDVSRGPVETTFHLKAVGWSESANIYSEVCDNGHSGYACGFNRQGDIEILMRATGELIRLALHRSLSRDLQGQGDEAGQLPIGARCGPAGSAGVSETTPATSEVIFAEAGHRPVPHAKAERQERRSRLCAAVHSAARLAFAPSPAAVL
jgi:hypothetical protein